MSYNGDSCYDPRRGGQGQGQAQHYNYNQLGEQGYEQQRAYGYSRGTDYGNGSGSRNSSHNFGRDYGEGGNGVRSYSSSGRCGGGSYSDRSLAGQSSAYDDRSRGGRSGGYDDRSRSDYDNRGAYDVGNSCQRSSYGSLRNGSSSGGYEQSRGGYGGNSSGTYNIRSHGFEGRVADRGGYGNDSRDRNGSHVSTREEDDNAMRGGHDYGGGGRDNKRYGEKDRERGRSSSSRYGGTVGGSDYRDSGSRSYEGGGGHFGGSGDRFGSGERRGGRAPGVGEIDGCGYENIGDTIMDPRKQGLWAGRVNALEVKADDPDLLEECKICRRPSLGKDGRSIKVHVNYFGISLETAPAEIFKYHVDVQRTRNPDEEAQPRQPQQPPGRPLPRSLVRNVINAALRQYVSVFRGIRVVHDGMSALYSPTKFDWNAKDFADINPENPSADCVPSPERQPQRGGERAYDAPRCGFRVPRTFSVKVKLAESISVSSIDAHYKSPDENVMPVIQALDVVARHLGAQRLIAVGRNFFGMKKTRQLKGGKELCWGYHQAIRVTDRKLLMNVDQAATVFYAPGELMALAMSALNVRSALDVQRLSERDMKNLARTFRKIEVIPKHRKDRKRAIFGVSPDRADRTVVDIKGETMSVADYFMRRYNTPLRYPNLPLVNVGSKKAGRENWLPIELCEVAPGQRCPNINDLDTAEIIRQTSQPPHVRRENIINQVHQAGFENDPYLAAFGVKIGLQPEVTEARVLDPPEVQYANVSERPSGGQWNLKDKRFVTGATLCNWGVVVDANISKNDVRHFIHSMVDMGSKSGLVLQSRNPPVIDRSACPRDAVEELMKTCFREMNSCGNGPPQLIVVVKQDKSSVSYGRIKRISDTVLGIPSQCIVASNVRNTKPTFCANVCLKINMKLNGKNSILREPLPLVSSTPTIILGADVSHPRSGIGSRPSIASVVGSMDAFSAKYIARVAAQKASSDILQLPHMLREIFMAFYQSTNRQPERVVYYRDGVSEGQFFDILQSEMRALRKAFKMLSEDYNPPVTFIIVNKRHHMRAFPVNPRDADRKGNVVPGTVIDSGVVSPHRFDFFLYGHSGIQGTSVPCHYTVLHDENKMSADDLQRLTYHLGYTFSRCTRSVSFATPAYYAHLAAGRARFFLFEGSSDAASTMSTNVSDTSNFDFAGIHKNLMDCMFYM